MKKKETGGRPSMDKYISLDIGGTYIKKGIVNESGEILKHHKEKTPKTLEELFLLIEQYILQNSDTLALTVSCPGAVTDEGLIQGASAVSYLHGPNIKQMLKARIGLPVYMENDANCAAYAEIWKGAAKGRKDVLVVVIGTGIGGAVVKDGLIHRGANLHGGEFGYMLIPTKTSENGATWSQIASTKALVKKVAQQKQLDASDLTGEAIFDMADMGDIICIEALEAFYHSLALGIYNLQYIYDPEIILIGGGISERNDLVDRIDGKLTHIIELIEDSTVKPMINTCAFRQHANLLGSVYGFLREKELDILDIN